MRVGSAVAAAFGVVAVLLVDPVGSLAATTTDCPNPVVVPESPAGPALLMVVALGALGCLAYRRRRNGLLPTILSTLTVVILCSALLGTVLAAAAPGSCSGGLGGPTAAGGVAAVSTGDPTPLTGADIPWITAGVLILLGTVATTVSRSRRRAARTDPTP